MEMQQPDLNKMWETFVRIGIPDYASPKPFLDFFNLIQIIRSKIYPMISRLQNDGVINWYCFLVHDRKSGVPTTEDDYNCYFHIRVSLRNDVEPSFPNYCVMTRKIKREWVESISGIDKSLLKNEEIEEAWRIIGEQSEWLLGLLNIYKDELDIPPQQIKQFFHYFFNITHVSITCPRCGSKVPF